MSSSWYSFKYSGRKPAHLSRECPTLCHGHGQVGLCDVPVAQGEDLSPDTGAALIWRWCLRSLTKQRTPYQPTQLLPGLFPPGSYTAAKGITFSSASRTSCAALGSTRCPFELVWFAVCTLGELIAHCGQSPGLGMDKNRLWTRIEEETWRELLG